MSRANQFDQPMTIDSVPQAVEFFRTIIEAAVKEGVMNPRIEAIAILCKCIDLIEAERQADKARLDWLGNHWWGDPEKIREFADRKLGTTKT